MPFYRPKSFLSLVLSGFVCVSLPLVVALIYAEWSMETLANRSAQVVFRSVKATEVSRELVETLIALERKARLYDVLGGAAQLQEMAIQHTEIQDILGKLLLLPLEVELIGKVQSLQGEETQLFQQLQTASRKSAATQKALDQFSGLHAAAGEVEAASRALIYREVDAVEKFTAESQQKMVWQAAVLVPLSGLFLVFFVRLISRPIVQLNRAINRLGEGDFATPVQMGGTRDLARLGQRLDWMRSQLADVERAKSRFVSQISHELKTPLASMREGSELLRDSLVGELNPPQREIVDILCKSSRDLQKLIENLLGFSKVQAGVATSLNRSEVDVKALVAELCRDYTPLLVKKALQLHLEIEPSILHVDREQLRTLIDNLISNAVKFTPQGGEIALSGRAVQGLWLLDVADSGAGVDPVDRERLFDPFYQGSRPGSGPVKGTGLGLSIAREIARAHGGDLCLLDGTVPGCRMRLSLPLVEASLS